VSRQTLARNIYIVAAGFSFLLSVYLWFSSSKEQGLFVGLWVPSILSFGSLMLKETRDVWCDNLHSRLPGVRRVAGGDAGCHHLKFGETEYLTHESLDDLAVGQVIGPAVGGEDRFVEFLVGQVEPGGTLVVEVGERGAGACWRPGCPVAAWPPRFV
jgi:hypothetical protein